MSSSARYDSLPMVESTSPSPQCRRCEALPDKLTGPGTLYLRFPLSHTLGKVLLHLRQENCSFQESAGTVLVHIPDINLAPFAQALGSVLTLPEQRDIRSIFQPEGHELQLADYLEADSLYQFIGRAQTNWLVDMLSEERLVTLFQPIVHAGTQEIFAYEGLLRGIEGGQFIPPIRLLNVAKSAGLLFQLDLAARRSAIRHAAQYGVREKVFINFTPTSVYDPRNCLRRTVEFVGESGLTPEQVVFEVIESERVEEAGHLTSILDFYRERGFLVALDDLGSGYSSLNMLASLRPDFVKLDRELIQDVHSNDYKATIAANLIDTACRLGVQVIAEGVETAEEYRWLVQNGAHYVQGYYFAKPALPPPVISEPRLC